MKITKEFYFIYRISLSEDNMTINDIFNLKDKLLESNIYTDGNKAYNIIDILIKEENDDIYKLFITVDDVLC